ncbi:hypothetical protein ACIQ6Y_21735 [Streptomyces sp. NPDC096205]|uniref:hypothetical protein n=1 Tax=Streptomyces sp. NPDC096205 TaxID=3366081 RepID=UPI0037F31B8A
MSNKLLEPDGWLVLGLPWPEHARDGWAECALALAPQTIPRGLVEEGTGIALDLAGGLARDPGQGPGRAVFFSDVTVWLDRQGQDWGMLGVDHEAVIDELTHAPVPQLYLTLSQKAHAVLCDASREGLRLHYANGDVERVSPQVRADVHAAITSTLERDWRPYVQGLIDGGAIRIG